MSFSAYEASIVPLLHGLRTVLHLLGKAEAHPKKLDLVNLSLIADMKGFAFQVQRASDTAKGVAVRLGGHAPVSMPDEETTMAQLRERMTRTIAVLEEVKAETLNAAVQRNENVDLKFGKEPMSARTYLFKFAMPNFYFHVTTIYALLRKEAVELGKMDYINMN
jgi:hypothetical protein